LNKTCLSRRIALRVPRFLLPAFLALAFPAAARGADFGLTLGTEGVYADSLSPEGFSVTSTASPWFSAVLSETMSLYVSGKMTFAYEEKGEPPESYFFEVERTELNLRPAPGLYFTVGRQRFQDPAGLTAGGLFDGAGGSVKLGISRLSLGAYYTGLLYKETAKIIMTSGDLERYEKSFDLNDLEGYFASRRVLLALTGEFPDLTSRISLTAQALAQFDVNGGSSPLHSQYLELRFAVEPADPLHLTLGGIGELAQGPEEVWGSMAAFAGADWEVPGALTDMLSAEFLWTSGQSNENIRAFTPVSGKNAGRVFDGGIGALARAAFSYRARPLTSFSLEAGAAYFIRTDLQTLMDTGLDGDSTSRLLGGELYGSLVWAPDPAFRFSAGGGAFFPGRAFQKDAAVRWKADLGVIVSF
jgi:hypothetical protein